MILIFVAAMLVLAVASYQVVQGLYSALIMTFLTILSAVTAFNFYEPLAQLLYERQPEFADAIALLTIFVILLLGLRIAADRFLGANVVFGVWADRIGGGLLGLISGMILIGMLFITIQMLPFGESMLGCRTFDDALQPDQKLAPFYPDDFTLGMVDMLSKAALGSDPENHYFTKTHDNLKLEAFCARNTAGTHCSVDAKPDSMKIIDVFNPSLDDAPQSCRDDLPLYPESLLPESTRKGEPQKKLIFRVTVSKDIAAADHWWRLPATHFRLVSATGRSYYPVGYLTAYEKKASRHRRDTENKQRTAAPNAEALRVPWLCHTAPTEEQKLQLAKLIIERPVPSGAKSITIDWVYSIPTSENPDRMVFRRVCSRSLSHFLLKDKDNPKVKKFKSGWPDRPDKQDAMDRLSEQTHR